MGSKENQVTGETRFRFAVLILSFLFAWIGMEPSFGAIQRTVGANSDYPSMGAAIQDLAPFSDDVVLSVKMGYDGIAEPGLDIDEDAGIFNGHALTVIPISATTPSVTYYLDDIEYRIGDDGAVETIENVEGGVFTARKVYSGSAPPGGTEFLLKNNLGSTVTVTNEQGEVAGPFYEYQAYGAQDKLEVTASARVTETYSGKELDEFGPALNGDGAGLYHYGARYYDADLGLWLSVDSEFETFNPYSFAANNPILFMDGDGRSVYTKAGKVIFKLIKTGDAASAFADNVQDAAILFGSNATLGGRVIAGLSLASEFLPVSVGDLKDGYKIARMVSAKAKKLELKFPETAEKMVASTGSAAAKGTPSITTPYKRPSGATTRAQRESVQGQPCVDCGTVTPKQVADHKKRLVDEYYETGTIDRDRMRSLDAVQAQCPTCSAKQGADASRYSRQKKEELGL